MKYLLDTCTISDIVRGRPKVLQQFSAIPSKELAFSCISRMELDYGLELAPAQARTVSPMLQLLLHPLAMLPFNAEDAKAAGRLRAELRRNGQTIGPYDVLIAGCVLARNLVLVTSNIREFGRVPHLCLENWR